MAMFPLTPTVLKSLFPSVAVLGADIERAWDRRQRPLRRQQPQRAARQGRGLLERGAERVLRPEVRMLAGGRHLAQNWLQ